MATLYKPNGEISEVLPASGKAFTLKELQAVVGGTIEEVPTPSGPMIINDDGKGLRLPRNEQATKIASWIAADDFIAGPALLVSETEFE